MQINLHIVVCLLDACNFRSDSGPWQIGKEIAVAAYHHALTNIHISHHYDFYDWWLVGAKAVVHHTKSEILIDKPKMSFIINYDGPADCANQQTARYSFRGEC